MSQKPAEPASQPDSTQPDAAAGGAAGAATGGVTGAPADDRSARVAAAVKTWQRHLVGLGGRNTLLWYSDLPTGTLDLTTAHPGGVAMLLAGRPTKLSDLVREPAALQEARRRVRAIRAKAIELHEERGIAAGFIAVGMATWQVPGSSRPPAAPVLLRSCVLNPTGPAHQDFAIDLGDEAELNPVLEHYLRSEQEIEVDAEAIADLATVTRGFDPQPAFAALTRACADVPGFTITPRLVVGTFFYAKLPMVADLAAQADTLAAHDVVAALAGDPQALTAVRTELPRPPADGDPRREHLVLDADASQQAAVDAARAGVNLVLSGPPGTGKSQTIANLVASLAADGKRVLFVAEKRAAIDTVLGRLDQVGLGDLVLDVGEGVASRRRIARELGSALQPATEATDQDTSAVERDLLDRRTRLVEHCAALHERREPWGVSAYEAQTALARLSLREHAPASRVRIHGDALARLSRERLGELSRSLQGAAAAGAWGTTGQEDPWYGARITSAGEADEALEIAGRLSGRGLDSAGRRLAEVMKEAGLPPATRAAEWGHALEVVEQVRQTLEVFRPEVFDVPLTDFVGATASRDYRERHGIDLSSVARLRLRRHARSLLRPGPPPADLHTLLLRAQEQRVAWGRLAGAGGRPQVPGGLDEAEQIWAGLARDLHWLGERLSATAAGGDLTGTPLPQLQQRLGLLASRADRLSVVPRVTRVLDELRSAGLGAVVDDLAARGVSADEVAPELDLVWWASLLAEIGARDPRYGAHDGEQLRQVAAEYIEADHAHLDRAPGRVRAAVARRVRSVLADHPEQEALVRQEAQKSRRHLPLRDLLPQAAQTLTAVKPCWVMSPLVVASVLPVGRWFDVVIFDEASQIPPAEAVSAIARAGQVVVAGDERQLPPSGFLAGATDVDGTATTGQSAGRAAQDETATRTVSAEHSEGSVLDALAAALPVHRLSWHYRSLDERLVDFANQQMYDGSLVTFPGTVTSPGASAPSSTSASAASSEAAVRLEVVDGSALVQPGDEAIESTPAEVDRVVRLVLSHARTRPQESLCVVTLGMRHAARIEEALRAALAVAPDVAGFFEDDRTERFFVKHLEQVQGDERDAVILSVGYGKTPHGRVLHRFGLLSVEGGERGLNVAVTRARRRMTVVSAFSAADLDADRLKARGARMLRELLAYAAAGGVIGPPGDASGGAESSGVESSGAESGGPESGPAPDVTGSASGEPLMSDFARRLRAHDLVVHERYGASGCPLDLAIEDPARPGRGLVAVESDGPDYAAMPGSRDRDRLRVEQLRRLGWTHLRLWSTDVFRDPARDLARVLAVVRSASAGSDEMSDTGPEDAARDEDQPGLSSGGTPDAEAEHDSGGTPEAEAEHDSGGTQSGGGSRSEATATDESRPAPGVPGAAAPARVARPEQTKDDTDAGWGERPDEDEHDRWLRDQRPPHWG